jgi:hypothetical protein
LILLVSNSAACETAIRFHLPTLERCWLICSPKILEQAQALCQQFPQVCVDQPIVVNDIYKMTSTIRWSFAIASMLSTLPGCPKAGKNWK